MLAVLAITVARDLYACSEQHAYLSDTCIGLHADVLCGMQMFLSTLNLLKLTPSARKGRRSRVCQLNGSHEGYDSDIVLVKLCKRVGLSRVGQAIALHLQVAYTAQVHGSLVVSAACRTSGESCRLSPAVANSSSAAHAEGDARPVTKWLTAVFLSCIGVGAPHGCSAVCLRQCWSCLQLHCSLPSSSSDLVLLRANALAC